MILISPSELASRLDDPDLRVADVRWYLGQTGKGRREYEAGHVPGAMFLDLDADLSAPEGPGRHPLPDPGEFARRLEARGIGSEHLVVAYDDAGGTVAARLWWMLDNLGHPSVALLDGGLRAWQEAGLPVTRDAPSYPAAHLELAERWSRVIDRSELQKRLGEVVLLDARAPERYRGEVEPVDPAAGHIPTASSAPATGNLGPDGRFLPADRLRARFGGFGSGSGSRSGSGSGSGEGGSGSGSGEVVTSCGSGVTACHNAFAMRLAGLPDPVLYPGSFSDWSRAGMPVVAGSEPGGLEGSEAPAAVDP